MTADCDHRRRDRRGQRSPRGRGDRGYTLLPHTADVGFVAHARDVAGLFEEATQALAGLTADSDPGIEPTLWREVGVEAGDPAGLAYAWLNELITLGDLEHAVVTRAHVAVRQSHAGAQEPAWRIDARVGLHRYADGGLRVRLQPKSATFHGLRVEAEDGGWVMTAYLDV